MSEKTDKPLVSGAGRVFDFVLAILFFLFMSWVLIPHIPSQDPMAVIIVAAMASFWIATNMLRVTWVDYSRRKSLR